MFPLRDVLEAEAPETGGRRAQNRVRTRARLNEAAVRLFAEQGYEATSVEDIAVGAGVSVRTLFRYFAGKEDVLFARRMDIRGFLAAVAAQPSDVPPLDAVRDAYLAQPPLSDDEVALMLRFRDAMGTSAVLQGRYVQGQRELRAELARVLARRADRQEPAEADLLAATVGQGVLDHVFTRWLGTGGAADLRAEVATAFALLDRIVAARTASG